MRRIKDGALILLGASCVALFVIVFALEILDGLRRAIFGP